MDVPHVGHPVRTADDAIDDHRVHRILLDFITPCFHRLYDAASLRWRPVEDLFPTPLRRIGVGDTTEIDGASICRSLRVEATAIGQ